MAYVIGDDCIACGTCIDECPAGAISEGEKYSLFSGHVQLIFYADSENIHLFTRNVLLSAAKNDLTEAELLHRLCRLNTWPDKLAGLRESTLRKLLF